MYDKTVFPIYLSSFLRNKIIFCFCQSCSSTTYCSNYNRMPTISSCIVFGFKPYHFNYRLNAILPVKCYAIFDFYQCQEEGIG